MKEEVYQRENVALDSWLNDRADITTIKLWEFSIQLVNFRKFSSLRMCYSDGAWGLAVRVRTPSLPWQEGKQSKSYLLLVIVSLLLLFVTFTFVVVFIAGFQGVPLIFPFYPLFQVILKSCGEVILGEEVVFNQLGTSRTFVWIQS